MSTQRKRIGSVRSQQISPVSTTNKKLQITSTATSIPSSSPFSSSTALAKWKIGLIILSIPLLMFLMTYYISNSIMSSSDNVKNYVGNLSEGNIKKLQSFQQNIKDGINQINQLNVNDIVEKTGFKQSVDILKRTLDQQKSIIQGNPINADNVNDVEEKQSTPLPFTVCTHFVFVCDMICNLIYCTIKCRIWVII